MYIERVLSLNNGWNILTNEKKEELEDVKLALLQITNDVISKALQEQADLENNSGRTKNFIPYFLHSYYRECLQTNCNWKDELPLLDNSMSIEDLIAPFSIKAVKNNVSASIARSGSIAGNYFVNTVYLSAPTTIIWV
jgi:hypothetical protein